MPKARTKSHRTRAMDCRLAIGTVLVGSLLACFTTTGGDHLAAAIQTSGQIRFDNYEAATCEGVGPSPVGRCSTAQYSGGLDGTGYYAVQSLEPVVPDGMVFITENEVLRLTDGELRGRVNAVFHSKSPDLEVASLHTIIGGTGHYAGASGYIQLWRARGEVFEYVAVIRFGAGAEPP